MTPFPPELLHLEHLFETHALIEFFSSPTSSPVTAVRVSARLDVIGGIADYSGAHVAQGILAPGVVAAVQSRADDFLHVRTLQLHSNALPSDTYVPLQQLAGDYAVVGARFKQNPLAAWAAYPIGSLLALLREQNVPLMGGGGFNILLISSIPMNVGIASSAAVEIATLSALNAHLKLDLPPLRLAELGQLAENRIVGAPCGIMDQIAIATGKANTLTHILCRPGQILGSVDIPPNTTFLGLSSCIRHSVAAAPYANVRIGAFIGKKIINTLRAKTNFPPLQYLTELTPDVFCRDYLPHLPGTLTGQAFLDQYHSHDDPVTRIHAGTTYRIAGPTRHPIEENARVLAFIAALQTASEDSLRHAGQLMFQAHESYKTNCHLSTPEIDTLIDAIHSLGPDSGIYGAKITGGGAGGTLALFAKPNALTSHLPQLLSAYTTRTGLTPQLFQSPAAATPSSLVRRYGTR